ncbi:MAG: CcmD family protein [Clostridia bacterium]|nr:CcmD family protein [Clostridia bacterium]
MAYLVAAYTLIWFGLAAYILALGRRQRRLEAEIRSLEAAIGEGEAEAP